MTQTKEPDKPDNLRIWSAVSKTNPAYTKKVNQRGGFTAIAAHSQVMEATRQFGPVGLGWGYDTHEPIFKENLVIIPVTIWFENRGNHFGPLYGSAELVNDKGRVDHDAPKKATTDALTKGLSQLGFNADVFLGLFDDDKYVEQMRNEFSQVDGDLITKDQIKELEKIAQDVGASIDAFCDYIKVAELAEIRADKFNDACELMRKKRKPPVRTEREAA